MNDEFERLINSGKLRPVPGSLIGVKYRPDLIDTGVVGKVKGRQVGTLVVVEGVDESPEDALVASTAVVVRLLGQDLGSWRSRFQNIEYDHKTTWAEQRIEPGTIVFARAVSQAPLGVDADYVQLRYDDIAAVAVPLDEVPTVPCIPAPGFVLVKKLEYEDKLGSLFVKPEYAEVLSEGAGMRGVVAALPRADHLIAASGISVGDVLNFSRFQLSEYIDLEGGYRLIHFEDVLAVEDSDVH